MSYVLDFAFADVSIRKRKGSSSRLRLCNSDWALSDNIRKQMNSNHPIPLDKRTGTDYCLDITQLKIVEDTDMLGMTEKKLSIE